MDPLISGNKWRKLKYNLIEMDRLGKKGIATFGGAYSNHLHAVAAAGQRFNFSTVGIVRGEEAKELSATLQECREMGMELHFVDREAYRSKTNSASVQDIFAQFPDHFVVAEGGEGSLGEKGCVEIWEEITLPADYLCLACGTGTTLKGLVAGNALKTRILGFPVLKGISAYLPLTLNDCELFTDYHFGGYAKHTTQLIEFMKDFERETGIPLEQVYTGKMMYGLCDLILKGYFKKGSQVVALHTGGLQGRSTLI